MSVAKTFFGSRNHLRELLANAVREKRIASKMTQEEMDDRCLFDIHGLPRCNEFENDFTKMTPFVFSLASFTLGLNIDEVLQVDLSDPERLRWVLDHMRKNKAGLAAAQGGQHVRPRISREQQAPVYVMLKALEEIEPRS